MADQEQLKILRSGVYAWNTWRRGHGSVAIDLTGAKLRRANLASADLARADLSRADLGGADCSDADFGSADLVGAKLSGAVFTGANFTNANLVDAKLDGARLSKARLIGAQLIRADLSQADLTFANLHRADCSGAHFFDSALGSTIFGATNLTRAIDTDTCDHRGPSVVDYETLEKSGPLPLDFLRGCGLPEHFIGCLPTLSGVATEFHACFISHAAKDAEFVDRLVADLRARGVRYWFAPHDAATGDAVFLALEQAASLHDKVLLVLSTSVASGGWVDQEVRMILKSERQHRTPLLVPITIDDAAESSTAPWASTARGRNITDFRRWRDRDAYDKALGELLGELTQSKDVPAERSGRAKRLG